MATEKFLMEMELPSSQEHIFVQYIVNYVQNNEIHQDLIEILKIRIPTTNLANYMNKNIVQFNNESIIVSDIVQFDEKDIWAFGVHQNSIIKGGTYIDTSKMSQDEIIRYATNTVQQQIDSQKHLSYSEKTIGGHIEYHVLTTK